MIIGCACAPARLPDWANGMQAKAECISSGAQRSISVGTNVQYITMIYSTKFKIVQFCAN